MQRNILFPLVLMFLLACNPARKFTSIRTVYDKDAQMRPGAPVAFGVVAKHKNGKKYVSKGFLKGKYKMDNYQVAVTGGWQEGGLIFIDTLEDKTVNRSVKVIVNPEKKPSLKDSFEFALNYEGIVTWNFNGEKGMDGKDKSARFLPVRIGGTGILDGKTGDSGTSGYNGADVELLVYKVHDDSFYNKFGYDLFAVKVITQNGGNVKFTYIAEKYGKLILRSNGGAGGNGGDGGRGVNGNDENSNGVAGNGTDGGMGGLGGDGGRGGRIKVSIDSAARDFVKYLEIQNKGGLGGRGGKGGAAGQGGTYRNGGRAQDGRAGRNGSNGNNGADGPAPEIIFDRIWF